MFYTRRNRQGSRLRKCNDGEAFWRTSRWDSDSPQVKAMSTCACTRMPAESHLFEASGDYSNRFGHRNLDRWRTNHIISWACPWVDLLYETLLLEAARNTTTTNSTGLIDYLKVKSEIEKQKNGLVGKHVFDILIYVIIVLAIVALIVILIEIWRCHGKNKRRYFARKLTTVKRIMVRPNLQTNWSW